MLTAAVSAAAAAATSARPAGCPVDPTKLSLTGVHFGQAVVAILAVLAVSAEYSTGMIRVTLAAMPRRAGCWPPRPRWWARWRWWPGTVAVPGSALAGRLILPGIGFAAAQLRPLSWDTGRRCGPPAGSVLYLALIALLSLGIATIVRDSAVAIGLVLGCSTCSRSSSPWPATRPGSPPESIDADDRRAARSRRPPGCGADHPWAGLGVLALWAGGRELAGTDDAPAATPRR